MPKRTYRLRVLGMGLATLPLMVVMHELQASWIGWSWMLITCWVWPHLAYVRAIRSKDPFRTELHNLIIDSAIAGSWVPLMHFNLLPSVMLLGVTTADKVTTGVRRLWLYSLPAIALSVVGCTVLTGFTFAPHSSMRVILACLPIIVIHTLAVSLSSARLVRRVQMQNKQLEELSRVDALTGLSGRRHWEAQAESMRRQSKDFAGLSVLLLDIDHFKEINDQHGHSSGDDVLRGIAGLIRRQLPKGSLAGRLGGDELAIVIPLPLHDAEILAEAIRRATSELAFPEAPGMSCTVSIGVAGDPDPTQGLREWIEAADRALYQAKRAGRNQAMTSVG
ncbi:MAG: diguanylate cyclase [Dokdonella sp.]